MVRVKICGIRDVNSARMAVDAGADAIGLLVGQRHPSSDFIDESVAQWIVYNLPALVSSVLVTHETECAEIIKLARRIGVSTVQLHGGTTPAQVAYLREHLRGIKLVAVVHMNGAAAVAEALAFDLVADAILLDTANAKTGQVGGTGLTHDWTASAHIVRSSMKPVMLAGGLNPSNVAAAIAATRPFGVDVNSGTKGADGFKDPIKLAEFIAAAKLFN